MYTNLLLCGLLTIQDDPDSPTTNPGAIYTTGSIKANTFITATSYIRATDYLMSNTYIQAPYCNFTSATQTNTFSGPLSLAATSSLTSLAAGQFTNLTTTSSTVANTFAGPLSVQGTITGASSLSITNQITCANLNAISNISNTFTGLVITSSGLVCNSTVDATTSGTGTAGAQAGALTNIGGFSNYLSMMIGGRLTLANVSSSVISNYPSVNSSAGAFFHCNGQTWNDANTATSTTASGNFYGAYFGLPTLTASRTGVTTSLASSVFIAGAPSAGTNQTLTSSYALYIQSGNALFGGTADANLSNTAIAALNVSGGITVAKSMSATNVMMTGFSAVYNPSVGTNGAALVISYQMTPNMVSGSRTESVIGQASSLNNTGILNFNYVAAGSTSNTFGFGLFGSNNRLTINGAGQVAVATTTNATSTTNGAVTIAGGGGVVKDWYVGGTLYANQINITSTVNSTSTTTGAIIAQSAGFAQDVYINQVHSIQQYFVSGYLNTNQTIAGNNNTQIAGSIVLNASSSTTFANALTSGNGTVITFTAPNRAKYDIAFVLIATPNFAGKIQGWVQINSPVLYNGTLRRGYINRAVAANTLETFQLTFFGPLNAGDAVTFYLLFNPTALIAVNPSIAVSSSTFSSLDISTSILND